jgi:hypothetical protein
MPHWGIISSDKGLTGFSFIHMIIIYEVSWTFVRLDADQIKNRNSNNGVILKYRWRLYAGRHEPPCIKNDLEVPYIRVLSW